VIVAVRHAETEWSLSGRHTGSHSDIPLTDNGRAAARELPARIGPGPFAAVLTSPLSRARETCELAGFAGTATADLLEWDYGDYEGLTTPQIREQRPGWDLWRDGCPGGESAADVGARADRVLASLPPDGDALLFAHGHILRVLTARWLELDAAQGALFALVPAGIARLGFERARHVLTQFS
jgi:probable phosphoglycerate mutase